MIAPGYPHPSGSAGGAGGRAARVSTSVRYALAVGLLMVGFADLAAVDLVLLPRYFSGARPWSPPARLPPAATPTVAVPMVLPPENPAVPAVPAVPVVAAGIEPSSQPAAPAAPPPSEVAPEEAAPAAASAETAPANLAPPELPHLLFARNTSWLSPAARETLAQLAMTLAEDPGRRVLLSGHSDTSGPEELNRALSLERAQKCEHWLKDHGVDPARMETQGFGSARPLDGDGSLEAQAHNRRVEIDLR